jgi:predicted nucleotidyltransferase
MRIASTIRLLSRSRAAEILEFLLSQQGRTYTINELARATAIPVATLWHGVQSLAKMGYLIVDRVGNSSVVRVNESSPAVRAFAQLAEGNPYHLAFEAYARILRRRLPGVEVRLFGSVAKGSEVPGSDVDVEVVYGPTGIPKQRVADECAKATIEILERFRIMVSPVVSGVAVLSA